MEAETMENKNTIEMHHIDKTFGHDTSKIQVLKDIEFTAQRGEMSLVIGPSGSGKSTFLTIAGGLQTPTAGDVRVEDTPLTAIPVKQRDALRLNKIGFILQAYNLVPFLTVREQFRFVDRIKGATHMTEDELMTLLADLGIQDLITKYPNELSGGQTQRVAIARALYPNPEIVLADEPTAALDSERVTVVGQLLHDLAKKHNKSIIVVTHDMRLKQYADHIYEILDGSMRQAS
ncbi:ABC transporter, ATP-binding protein [Schleiferilactobacillus harbinensis DSM 16991]|jgi:putative ABC transport system ATP-binding protein|uniref:Putative hemin import ATP-binding protein HrtA n=2 Tax=Schleiferilactobacillus harbinensis TaxID=304207 RepID=A0A0R1XN35_9LACO|nr:ABC transporter, ATP-binding protein [Schleiferilactobacillus harbinensis DSM 16991]